MKSHPPYQAAVPADQAGLHATRLLLSEAHQQWVRLDQQVKSLDEKIAELQTARAGVADARTLAMETVDRYRQVVGPDTGTERTGPETWTGPETGVFQAPELADDPDASLGPRPSQAREQLLGHNTEGQR